MAGWSCWTSTVYVLAIPRSMSGISWRPCTARRWKERASPPATSPRRFSMRILSGVRIGLETRSRLFQAASLVRMAVRSLTQRPDLYRDGSDESVPLRLLDEATACLAAPRRV
jgi:hypothetical protein